MRVVTNQEKVSEILAQQSGIPQSEIKISDKISIVKYIDDCWAEARDAKENSIESQIIANMRQIDGVYDPTKLNAIKEIGGSEVFMMITDAKCKNATNWTEELLFQPGQRPWDIAPTPVPELPESAMSDLYEEIIAEIMVEITQSGAPGQPMQGPESMDPEVIQQRLFEILPKAQEMLKENTYQRAKELAEKISKEVDDKLVEGGWYSALRKCIPNIIMHTGFITGPIMKKRPTIKVMPLENGRLVAQVINDVIPTWDSIHPLNMYPAPDSTNINDGYLFERIKLTPIEIQNMIGVENYDEDEIREVLSEIEAGTLKEWLTVDQERADISGSLSQIFYDSDKVDCLKFSGSVKGSDIKEWGKSKDPDGDKIEDDFYYNIFLYKIGKHVISIQYNSDPLGQKPYYKTSFENSDGDFWGKGLPEIISDVQTVCNSVTRSLVNNCGIASGPMIERNIDRIPVSDKGNNAIVPWKVWDVTNDQMMMSGNGKAINFYQPPMVSNQLVEVYKHFSRIADEHSGVPAFAHGDTQVGGAGNTASGLSMLMGSAARGIKALIKAIDEDIIKPSVERQYFWLIEREDFFGMICDYKVISGGSIAALAREQMVARRLEFMNNTANPVDASIMGMEGRKYVLSETAKSLGLDLDKFLPKKPPAPPMAPPGQEGGSESGFMPPGQNSQQLDASGQPVVGQDSRMFNQ